MQDAQTSLVSVLSKTVALGTEFRETKLHSRDIVSDLLQVPMFIPFIDVCEIRRRVCERESRLRVVVAAR